MPPGSGNGSPTPRGGIASRDDIREFRHGVGRVAKIVLPIAIKVDFVEVGVGQTDPEIVQRQKPAPFIISRLVGDGRLDEKDISDGDILCHRIDRHHLACPNGLAPVLGNAFKMGAGIVGGTPG